MMSNNSSCLNDTRQAEGAADEIGGAIRIGLIVIGVPLNINAGYQMLKAHWQGKSFTRFSRLKLHLTLSNLIILTFYCVSSSVWRYTGSWNGGLALCKVQQSLNVFGFYLSSNIIVSIAFDRLITVSSRRSCVLGRSFSSSHYTRCIIRAAWTFAAISSLPQLFVWTLFSSPLLNQCTTVWQITLYNRCQKVSKTEVEFEICASIRSLGEVAYGIAHLFVVFWIPFLTIFSINVYVIMRHKFVYLEAPAIFCYTRQASQSSGADMCTGIWYKRMWQRRNRTALYKAVVLRRAVLLCFSYVVFWLPYNLMSFLEFFGPQLSSKERLILEYLSDMMIINAVVNPILYRSQFVAPKSTTKTTDELLSMQNNG